MSVAVYCRGTTDKADRRNSLKTQKNSSANSRRKTAIIRYGCADAGVSGAKIKKRTEFQRSLHDAESVLFGLVVVKDVSRIAGAWPSWKIPAYGDSKAGVG